MVSPEEFKLSYFVTLQLQDAIMGAYEQQFVTRDGLAVMFDRWLTLGQQLLLNAQRYASQTKGNGKNFTTKIPIMEECGI